MSDHNETAPHAISRWRQLVSSVGCAALLAASMPAPLLAQPAPGGPPPGAEGQQGGPPPGQQGEGYTDQQLDSIVAPIALYPDQLLTQVLMASAYPDQVKAAAQWLNDPANKSIHGDALTAALAPIPWDPSVKSLVPFPQVLTTMTSQPDWVEQLGYAMNVQQPAVMNAVQFLRKQAEVAGQLHTTPQQVVSTEQSAIVIAPAQPNVVYVPVYNPAVVYGEWPYPAYPPFYLPPPVGFYWGGAVGVGIAFGVGFGIVGGLWGFAHPVWGGGGLFINVNRYNAISIGHPWVGGAAWRAGAGPFAHPFARPFGGFRPAGGAGFHGGGFAGGRPGGGFPGAHPGFAGGRPPFHAPAAGGFHGAPGGFHPAAAGAHSPGAPGGAHSFAHPASAGHVGATHAAATSHAGFANHAAAAHAAAAPHAGGHAGFAPHAAAPHAEAPRAAPRAAPPRPAGGGGHAGGGGGGHAGGGGGHHR
jgi:hypothetical protein